MENKLHNISVDELNERLSKCSYNAEHNLIEASGILAELKRRGEKHPLMQRGLFKWFEQIDNGTLNPAIVIKFAGEDHVITHVAKLPITEQRTIAETGTLRIAEIDKNGDVLAIEKPIIRMSVKTLARAFDENKIRTVEQQSKLLKKEIAEKKPKAGPIVETRNGMIVIGNTVIDPAHFIEPLRRLGWNVTRRERAAA